MDTNKQQIGTKRRTPMDTNKQQVGRKMKTTESETTKSVDNSAVKKKMIELRSSDGELFQVEEKVAVQSVLISHLVDDGCGDSVIPLSNVTGKTLAKVIEYCQKHVEAAEVEANEEDSTLKAKNKKKLEAFDVEFMKVERTELLDIVTAANYLDIKGLFDLAIQDTSNRVKDMTVEQLRDFLHITNDYTPEEEEEVRNAWVFDE